MVISTAGIARRDNKYLVALRKPGTSIGTKWEFPGGKTEPGETPQAALAREYREELSLRIQVGSLLFEGQFKNNKHIYALQAYEVTLISDEKELVLTEHSEYRWVNAEEMRNLSFPASDSLIRDFIIQREEKS